MKKKIKKTLVFLMRLVWLCISYETALEIKKLLNLCYSFWLKNSLKNSTNNIHLSYPVNILGGKYIEIGDGFSSLSRLRIEAWDCYMGASYSPKIIIGINVCFNSDCHLACINKIMIGDNVLIGSRVLITDHLHGTCDDLLKSVPSERDLVSKGPVIIENNVWIGEGVSIMPNVTIGFNSIIGANSVVTKSVPPNTVVGGVPSKVIFKY